MYVQILCIFFIAIEVFPLINGDVGSSIYYSHYGKPRHQGYHYRPGGYHHAPYGYGGHGYSGDGKAGYGGYYPTGYGKHVPSTYIRHKVQYVPVKYVEHAPVAHGKYNLHGHVSKPAVYGYNRQPKYVIAHKSHPGWRRIERSRNNYAYGGYDHKHTGYPSSYYGQNYKHGYPQYTHQYYPLHKGGYANVYYSPTSYHKHG